MRRPFVVLAALLVAATTVATAACGGSDSGADTAAESTTAGAAFPVTLEHKYGSTTVPAAPKKVVTVGLTEQDALLALGVVPVATTEWLGGYPGAIGPWAQAKLNGATPPEVLKDTGGPQFERIAALKPDLILALYSGITQEQYQTLTAIAPTVAQPKEFKDYGVPWQEITKRVGKVVGKGAEAEKLVADVEAKFATAKQQNPTFQGATALMVTPYEGYFVYGRQDARSRVLTDLGFTLPTELDQVVGDAFGAGISGERTDMLDVDALVWIVADLKDAPARLHQDRLYAPLDVVTQGREVFIPESTEYGHATSFVSALSLPYLLDKLVPQLAAAVDGNASTAVPAS